MDFVQHYYDLLIDKLIGWSDAVVVNLPNLIVAAIVLVASIVVARSIRTYLNQLLNKLIDNQALARLSATILSAIIGGVGLFWSLSILHLDKTVTSLLAGAGVLGLALSFAFQDTATNFISGIIIAVRKPFGVGDHIRSNNYQGVVQKVSLRSTVIRTFQGQLVMIPNKDVFANPLVNYTSSNQRRVDLEVGVSYNDDLEKAASVATKAIEALDCRDQNREVSLVYTGFGDSSINFTIRYWVNPAQLDFLQARSTGVIAIKKAFDKHSITIPFPMRTLEIQSSMQNPLLFKGINGTNGSTHSKEPVTTES